MAGGFAGFGYSFVMTFLLVALMQIISIWIPALAIRASTRENEQVRLDFNELGDTEAVRNHGHNLAKVPCLSSPVSYRLPLSSGAGFKRTRAD
jgi:hypothetical protein